MKKLFILFFVALISLVVLSFVPAKAVLTGNPDLKKLDGIWTARWSDPEWSYGSAFSLMDGSVKGTDVRVNLQNDQLLLHHEMFGDIPFERRKDGSWSGQAGKKNITLQQQNLPHAIKPGSLDGAWNGKIYGTGSPLNLSIAGGKVIGLGAKEGALIVDNESFTVTTPEGASLWAYEIKPGEWVGFGRFPALGNMPDLRPIVLHREKK